MSGTPLKKTADAVVIGGGCNGTATALFLAKRGMKNVVLLEKNYLTSGATEDSIGNLRPYSSIETTARICQKGIEVFKNFDDVIGGHCGHVQDGRIWAVSPQRVKILEKAVADHQGWGIKVKMISPEDVKEMLPQAEVDGIGAAAFFEEAGNCDTVATTNSYAARARELGVSIYEETEATGISLSGGRVKSVATSRGEISTPVVVNAAGLWSDRVGKMAGLKIPMSVHREQNVLLKRPYDFYGIFPCFHDGVGELGYRCKRPDLEELILVFITYVIVPPDIVDPDNYNDAADKEFIGKTLVEAYKRMPILKRASLRGGATGLYDMTPDESPVFGAVPEVTGYYCNCGWSGRGFMSSPVMGDLMAELVTTGKTSIDVSLYRLSRFEEGKLLESGFYPEEEWEENQPA
ncbi:MAG: FAD-binding oxidoreductase [Chloroflexi bacterium]|nr:FAD-binding oxidoreductase [Chloroflexota bacterium]